MKQFNTIVLKIRGYIYAFFLVVSVCEPCFWVQIV